MQKNTRSKTTLRIKGDFMSWFSKQYKKAKDAITESILKNGAKKVLDKLPLDKYKTAIGVLIFVFGAALPFFPSLAFLAPFVEMLRPYAGDISQISVEIMLTGAVQTTVGLYHKYLKKDEQLAIIKEEIKVLETAVDAVPETPVLLQVKVDG